MTTSPYVPIADQQQDAFLKTQHKFRTERRLIRERLCAECNTSIGFKPSKKCMVCGKKFHLHCGGTICLQESPYGPRLSASLVPETGSSTKASFQDSSFTTLNSRLPRALMRRCFSRERYTQKMVMWLPSHTFVSFWPPDDTIVPDAAVERLAVMSADLLRSFPPLLPHFTSSDSAILSTQHPQTSEFVLNDANTIPSRQLSHDASDGLAARHATLTGIAASPASSSTSTAVEHSISSFSNSDIPHFQLTDKLQLEIYCLREHIKFLDKLVPDTPQRKSYSTEQEGHLVFDGVTFRPPPHGHRLLAGFPPSHPFDRSINLHRCAFFALVSQLTYSSPECTFAVASRKWNCSRISFFIWPATDSHGIGLVGPDNAFAVLGFRGTESAQNWSTNLQTSLVDLELPTLSQCPDASAPPLMSLSPDDDSGEEDTTEEAALTRFQIHKGYQTSLTCIWAQIDEFILGLPQPRPPLYLTGHSLGGAMAVVAYAYITLIYKIPIHGIYTFGQPRVCNSALARFLNSQPAVIQRIRNKADPVPTYPSTMLGYRHAGESILIRNDGVVVAMPTAADKRKEMYSRMTALTSALNDHSQANYVSIFLNLFSHFESDRSSHLSDLPNRTRYAVITISHARKLSVKDDVSPYLKLMVPGYLTLTTPVVRNSSNPVWNTVFHVPNICMLDELQFGIFSKQQELARTHMKILDFNAIHELPLTLNAHNSFLVISITFHKYSSQDKPKTAQILGRPLRYLLKKNRSPESPGLPVFLCELCRFIAEHGLSSPFWIYDSKDPDFAQLRKEVNQSNFSFFQQDRRPELGLALLLNWVQSLSSPITGYSMYSRWIRVFEGKNLSERLVTLTELSKMLRDWEYQAFQVLLFIGKLVTKNHFFTHVTPHRFAALIAPFIFGAAHPNQTGEIIEITQDVPYLVHLTVLLLNHYDEIFTTPLFYANPALSTSSSSPLSVRLIGQYAVSENHGTAVSATATHPSLPHCAIFGDVSGHLALFDMASDRALAYCQLPGSCGTLLSLHGLPSKSSADTPVQFLALTTAGIWIVSLILTPDQNHSLNPAPRKDRTGKLTAGYSLSFNNSFLSSTFPFPYSSSDWVSDLIGQLSNQPCHLSLISPSCIGFCVADPSAAGGQALVICSSGADPISVRLPEPITSLAIVHAPGGPKVWMVSTTGQLYVSNLLGELTSPIPLLPSSISILSSVIHIFPAISRCFVAVGRQLVSLSLEDLPKVIAVILLEFSCLSMASLSSGKLALAGDSLIQIRSADSLTSPVLIQWQLTSSQSMSIQAVIFEQSEHLALGDSHGLARIYSIQSQFSTPPPFGEQTCMDAFLSYPSLTSASTI